MNLNKPRLQTIAGRLTDCPKNDLLNRLGLPMPVKVIETRPGGYNSDIVIVGQDNGLPNLITKIYGVKKRPYTQSEALVTAHDLLQYRELLRQCKVNIPEMIDLAIVGNDDSINRYIVLTETLAGIDQISILKSSSRNDALRRYRYMLDASLPILQLNEPFQVTIDPLPGNYCSHSSNPEKIIFVDCMPPRYAKPGHGYLVEWPIPQTNIGFEIAFWKYYTRIGMLINMLTQMCRWRPALRDGFKDVLLSFANKHFGTSVEQSLIETPGWKIDGAMSEVFLGALVEQNIYYVRNFACELAYHQQKTSEELDKFFKICHFEDELDRSTKSKIVNTLLSWL